MFWMNCRFHSCLVVLLWVLINRVVEIKKHTQKQNNSIWILKYLYLFQFLCMCTNLCFEFSHSVPWHSHGCQGTTFVGGEWLLCFEARSLWVFSAMSTGLIGFPSLQRFPCICLLFLHRDTEVTDACTEFSFHKLKLAFILENN